MFLVAMMQVIIGISLHRARKADRSKARDWLVLCAPLVFCIAANFLLLRLPGMPRNHGVTSRDRA